jgi:hypothetical protein
MYNTFEDNTPNRQKSKEGIAAPYYREETDEEESKYSEPVQRVPYFTWAKLWIYVGPGWLMSIAYLDPGNSKLLNILQRLVLGFTICLTLTIHISMGDVI